MSRYAIDKTIDTAIRSGSDYAEFFRRFAWVGQLDYSLKFFQNLAGYAIKHVAQYMENILVISPNNSDNFELQLHADHFGWISNNINTFKGYEEIWCKTNSRYFVDNYIQIIIQTINYLLFRTEFHDDIINFEFEDAGNRLTEDKKKRILFFEGTARSTKSMMLILETIFIY